MGGERLVAFSKILSRNSIIVLLCHSLLIGIAFTWSGCQTTSTAEAGDPEWFLNPIRENIDNYFFPGKGISATSQAEAERLARENALTLIADRLGGDLPTATRNELRSLVRNWHIRTRDHVRQGGRHYAWVLLRYPKDEYYALEAYLAQGARDLERAAGAMEQRAYEQALSVLIPLLERYPLGEQSILSTERALLMTAAAHRQLGQPQAAEQALERILSLSQNEGFRTEAQTQLTDLREAWTPTLLRGVFGNKRVAIVALTIIDGKLSEWPKLSAELSQYASAHGGQVRDLSHAVGATDTAIALTRSEEARRRWMSEQGVDALLMYAAEGRYNVRDSARPERNERDYQFVGKLHVIVESTGREPFDWQRSGTYGWNWAGPEIAIEVPGLLMLAQWREAYESYLAQ